jgi:hypothetical protein
MKRNALILLIVVSFLLVGAMFPVYWVLVGDKQVLKARGDYSAIALKEMSGDPTAIPEYGIVYVKDDDTLMYIDGAGGSHDLTAGGGSSEWSVVGTNLGNTDGTVTQIDLNLLGSPVVSLKSINVPGTATGDFFSWGGGSSASQTEVDMMLQWDGAYNDINIGAVGFDIGGGTIANFMNIQAPLIISPPAGAPVQFSQISAYRGIFGTAYQGVTAPANVILWGANGDTAESVYTAGTAIGVLGEGLATTAPTNYSGVGGMFIGAGGNGGFAQGMGVIGIGMYDDTPAPTGPINITGVLGVCYDTNASGNNTGGRFSASGSTGSNYALAAQGEQYLQGWLRTHMATFGTNTDHPNFEVSNYQTDYPIFDIEFRGTAGVQPMMVLKASTTPGDSDFYVLELDKNTADESFGWDESDDNWYLSSDLRVNGGAVFLAERATPSAQANHGALYTKNDDKLYFQDGGGAEHEVAFAP